MPHKTYSKHNTRILYDTDWLENPEALFRPENQHCDDEAAPVERGRARFFEFQDTPLVLKHYHRGGLIGRLIRDTYACLPGGQPRMLAEFRLLEQLHDEDLPVPVPVAARCQFSGWLACRGDLITHRIPGSHTLYEHLCRGALSHRQWQAIGHTIARFHAAGVHHADLNATNILLDDRDRPWLIDFDKGRIRRHGRWKAANLKRLQRSLDKLKRQTPSMHYGEQDWQALLDGYHR
ncbi:MAG: 3-deoxy-D-manno-octulosonic acid kinase [Pseudohongiellaceae bacterium]